MSNAVLKLLDPGLGATLQDRGRTGWKCFGVPTSGAMDLHAAGWANRLLENPADTPVIEFLLQGAKIEILESTWIAVTGASVEANVAAWQTVRVLAGQRLQFPVNHAGVWIYLAVEGGIACPRFLGSASTYPRGKLGSPLRAGQILHRGEGPRFNPRPAVASHAAAWSERPDYTSPPPLRLWPGPQWNVFPPQDHHRLFESEWSVTPQSDRVGYRLLGEPLHPATAQIISEPVRTGSIQVPANGQPIVTMRDGPTVGGYPKIAMVDPEDLSWLAQCRPGQRIRFVPGV